jgi:hypothetical protein
MTAPADTIFAGWSANELAYAAGESYTVTADVTFTAQWADTYTVTYSAGEGEGTAPAAQSGVLSGEIIILPGQGSMIAPAEKVFAGWSVNGQPHAAGASYTVTADVTFTAHWVNSTGATYTVTYSAGGGEGTAPDAQSGAVSGVTIMLPDQGGMTAPAGKIFAGWSANGQAYAAGASYTVTANVTFTAQWVDTYTVTYSAGEGGGTAPDAQSGMLSGEIITLPGQGSMIAPADTIFAGWSAKGQPYAAASNYTVTATVTFTAQWVAAYTVTYSTGEGGGTAPDAQSDVAPGTSITLPGQGSMTAPAGKIFAGWSASGQTYAAGASYTVTATVTFTAQWVDSTTYTVTYSAGEGGGTAPDARSDVVSGTRITLPGQGSMTAPAGKTFAGWSAGGQTYAAGARYPVTADVTLTAQWRGVTGISAAYNGQTDYGIGEPFDLTHLTITAQYDNGTSGVITVTEANLAGWNNTAAGAQTITVTVESHTASQIISVTVKTLAERIAAVLETTGTATITLYADESLEPTSLSAASSTTITLKGAGAERTIRISGNGSLFTLSGRVALVLDSNITLQGKTDNAGYGLVYVNASTAALTMKAGSKITGNTTTYVHSATGLTVVSAGGVFMSGGYFTMEGGTITGNTSWHGGVFMSGGYFTMTGGTITDNTGNGTTLTGNGITSGTGGLYIGAVITATISGGEITGNTGAAYGDVAVTYDKTLALSGAPVIGNITLAAHATSDSIVSSKISVSAALTGSSYPVDLALISSSSLSLEAVKSRWAALTSAQRTIIAGDNAWWTGKFTLRNFVYNAETQAVTGTYPGASIGTDGILKLGSGSVSGTVALDGGGGSLSNVNVVLKKDNVVFATGTADAGGAYSFENLEIGGGYTLEASCSGYARATSASFVVTVAATGPSLTLLTPTAKLYDGEELVANDYTVLTALQWIAANAANNGNYTITLTANDTLEPYTLNSATLNGQYYTTITLKGEGSERILQIGDGKGPLFTMTASGATLVLDDNITLKGKLDNTGNGLVYVQNGTLKMKAGSTITGNTSTGNGGGVYVGSASFIMEGGSITGNTSTSTTAASYAAGGLSITSTSDTGTRAISGGTITGNIGRYGNVLVRDARALNLSGNPTIADITLVVNGTATGKIVVTGDFTSNAIPVDLARYNSADLAAVKTGWAALSSPQIIFGSTSPAYTLTGADIGKFTLRNFVHNTTISGATESVATTYSSAAINSTTNIGVLELDATTP